MTRAIMVQGCTSNAGKSYMVAALCRIFKQDGYSPAPFKSQNMALNSFITHEGLEMGRAQVIQAEAAGIEPVVAMNPILLKPTNDTGSQVIVMGEVLSDMEAREYFAFKSGLKPTIMEAYNSLAAEHDIMVIEGAGSPAEINLKDDDIVNMGMAKMANAPVLLVGDIDPGGVFASLYGTVKLLEPDEQERVKGLIINKFRGDKSLLDSGIDQIEELTGVPCLGVVPYLHLDIDDEDSLSTSLTEVGRMAPLDVCVIRLPHLSNFTDLNPLLRFEQISVRYTSDPYEVMYPDLIVLPGTKSTLADLRWLREKGLDTVIARAHAAGVPILGICGGYQMLGRALEDPEGVEGGGSAEGLGLLPTHTVFTSEKTRTRVEARVQDLPAPLASFTGATLSGYEIHMGATTLEGGSPFARVTYDDLDAPAKLDGCVEGNVVGSYLHGMFESGDFAERMVRWLCERKGIEPVNFPEMSFADYKESQYDTLADAVRASLDMDKVYQILEEGA